MTAAPLAPSAQVSPTHGLLHRLRSNGPRYCAYGVAFLFAALSAFIILFTEIYSFVFSRDEFIFLSIVYRIDWGQIPHVEFFSPLGTGSSYIGAWLLDMGVSVDAAQYKALLLINIASIFAALWLFRSLSGRWLYPIVIVLVAVFAGSLTNNTRFTFEHMVSLETFLGTSHGYYRPLSVGLFAVLMLRLLMPRGEQSALVDAVEAAVLAGLGLLLVFTKVTYVLPLVPLAGLSFVLFAPARRVIILATLMASALLVLWQISSGYTLGYIDDVRMASQINAARDWGRILSRVGADYWIVTGIYLAACAVCVAAAAGARRLLTGLALYGVAASLFTNGYDSGTFNYAIYAVFFAGVAILSDPVASAPRAARAEGRQRPGVPVLVARNAAMGGLGLMLLAHAHDHGSSAMELIALHGQIEERVGVPPEELDWADANIATAASAFVGGHLLHVETIPDALRCMRNSELRGRAALEACTQDEAYTFRGPGFVPTSAYFIGAAEILGRNDLEFGGVTVMDIGDAVSFQHGLRLARYLPAWYHTQLYSRTCSVPPEVYFYDLDYILWPKYVYYDNPLHDPERGFEAVHSAFLDNYRVLDENETWLIYERFTKANVRIREPRRYTCAETLGVER